MSLMILQEKFSSALTKFMSNYPDTGLYAPVHYLLSLRGKRIRPIIALAVSKAEGADLEDAMPAALAVELFHNFTLMHDDIMDKAPLRRGSATVHIKYSENAAVLSGDAMFSLSMTALQEVKNEVLSDVFCTFNKAAREVCEGQQQDLEFESLHKVSVDQYVEMIRKKTSVLLAASCAMGAQCAGASNDRVKLWYAFGEKLGLAFQIQDDFLDTFGESKETGKQKGGDILAEKKTFLLIHTLEKSKIKVFEEVSKMQPSEKINRVTEIMQQCRADVAAKDLMLSYSKEAMKNLDELGLSEETNIWFRDLSHSVTDRIS